MVVFCLVASHDTMRAPSLHPQSSVVVKGVQNTEYEWILCREMVDFVVPYKARGFLPLKALQVW